MFLLAFIITVVFATGVMMTINEIMTLIENKNENKFWWDEKPEIKKQFPYIVSVLALPRFYLRSLDFCSCFASLLLIVILFRKLLFESRI